MERLFGCISTAPAQGGTQAQAMGRSHGGLTTKILAVVDVLGNLGRFIVLPGQRHDSVGVEPVLDGMELFALLADKAFDSNAMHTLITERGAVAVIPSQAGRSTPIPHDAGMYKLRHLVESFFCKIKAFRRISTRFDKADTSFAAAIHLVVTALVTR